MEMTVQWLVVLGVWYCLLIDAVGNWAGQGGTDWLVIISGCSVAIVGAHLAWAWRYLRSRS